MLQKLTFIYLRMCYKGQKSIIQKLLRNAKAQFFFIFLF